MAATSKRSQRWLWGLGLLLCAVGSACNGKQPSAQFVEPELGDPCHYYDCSKRGVCAPDAAGAPACTCDDGFAGVHCESSVCFSGYHWDSKHECVPDQLCATQPSSPCGTHGVCDDSEGVVACACDPAYAGSRCMLCGNGYGRSPDDECLQLLLGTGQSQQSSPPPSSSVCASDSCNGHGQCSNMGGFLQCKCDAGYASSRCAACAADFHRDLHDDCVQNEVCAADSCSKHGNCDAQTGIALCQCDMGFGGTTCDRCAPGYHDPGDDTCLLDDHCISNSCAVHGTCSEAGNVVSCVCDMDYGGSHCETCANAHHRDAQDACVVNEICGAMSCSMHGMCTVPAGVIVCQCDIGYGGSICGMCAGGFHLDSRNVCVLNQQCQPNSCPTHASCDDSTGVVQCPCAAGYTGATCSTCASGYKPHANACVPVDCVHAPSCGANGACDDSSGAPVCVCPAGYRGALCDQCGAGYHLQASTCARDTSCGATTCDGHGSCTAAGQVVSCGCGTGYIGASCDLCASGYGVSGSDCRTCTSSEDFNGNIAFPSSINNCISYTFPLSISGMTFKSIGGNGTVWECGPDLLYSITSHHIALEAGTTVPAEIAFDGPITSLSFTYAARLGPLAVEIRADGQLITSFSQVNNAKGTQSFIFPSPIGSFQILSVGPKTSQIALDDFTYTLAQCTP